MPKIRYEPRTFKPRSMKLIGTANDIIDEYTRQGYDLTLRQLYYQFVARDVIPNNQRSYNRLKDLVANARLAGLIDWSAIQDRTRNLRGNQHWSSPAEIVQACAASYQIDKWATQPRRVEVWIEKDALVGVISGVCRRLDIPYFSCRGYTSHSEIWRAGYYRMRPPSKQRTIILHLGDHDPSGIDMTRDIGARLRQFSGRDDLEIRRLALNMDQVDTYDPPPNPAKTTDSRYEGYIVRYGEESWELDALEPAVISDLIEDAVTEIRDEGAWESALARERMERERLEEVAEQMGDE
jgi:hypothetical protein